MDAVKNDYDEDVQFGHWLREQRTRVGLTLEQAAATTGVPEARLKSLEMGYAEKGITMSESKKLSATYRVELKELLDKAVGK